MKERDDDHRSSLNWSNARAHTYQLFTITVFRFLRSLVTRDYYYYYCYCVGIDFFFFCFPSPPINIMSPDPCFQRPRLSPGSRPDLGQRRQRRRRRRRQPGDIVSASLAPPVPGSAVVVGRCFICYKYAYTSRFRFAGRIRPLSPSSGRRAAPPAPKRTSVLYRGTHALFIRASTGYSWRGVKWPENYPG